MIKKNKIKAVITADSLLTGTFHKILPSQFVPKAQTKATTREISCSIPVYGMIPKKPRRMAKNAKLPSAKETMRYMAIASSLFSTA